jgi:hypothetical protein
MVTDAREKLSRSANADGLIGHDPASRVNDTLWTFK